MLSWEEIVQNYIIKDSNKIKKTTKPLKDHFGIGYFTYHQIDNQGRYTVLVDRPDWAEHYINKKIFLNDPYLRHPDVYESGLCLVDDFGSEDYKQLVMKEGKTHLDMDMAVILIKKQTDRVEFFGFSGNKKNCCLQNLYLNNTALLHSFASHFKQNLCSTLKRMSEEANSLLELKGRDFLIDVPISPKVTESSKLAYLKDLGLKSHAEKAIKLSAREKECIKLLLEEKSAKESAIELGLSPRTVEFYFENIKNKLVCENKREVYRLGKTFRKLGIL